MALLNVFSNFVTAMLFNITKSTIIIFDFEKIFMKNDSIKFSLD